MSDYVKALRQGFEAAKKADLARKEIDETLKRFREDVLAGSDGSILIEVKQFDEDIHPLSRAAAMLGPRQFYYALAARNPKSGNPKYNILARWKQSNDGYPCSITIGAKETQYENRVALEQGLAALLRQPQIGEMLYSLTKQK